MFFVGDSQAELVQKSHGFAGFAHRGAVVVDADAIVKELQRSGTPVFEAMVERFGAEPIVGSDGELDRAAVRSDRLQRQGCPR